MVARRRRRSRKWLSRLLFLILIIIAGAVIYLVWDNYFRDDKVIEPGQSEVVEEEKPEEKSENVSEEKEPEKEETVQYEGDDPNTLEELTGVVTYAGVSGNKLMVRININQYLSGGSCKLSLVRNGATAYEDVAAVTAGAATSTCEGFDVPVSEITSGKYQILVEVTAEGKAGVIKGEVEV